MLSLENKTEKEVNRRKYIFKGNFKNHHKCEIFNMCVQPVLTYGSPTWSLTKKLKNKLRTTQNSMIRSLLSFKLKDHVKKTTLRNKVPKIKDILQVIRNLKWG